MKLLRNTRKTEPRRGWVGLFLTPLAARAGPFALLRNTRKTEPRRGWVGLFLTPLAARAGPFALLRNTRKTELPSAAVNSVFLASLGARTAPFTLPLLCAFLAAAQAAGSGSASLQCTSDQVEGNVLSLQFRTSLVVNWRLEKALLFVHVSQGRTPAKAAVSHSGAKEKGWQSAEIEVEAEGWIRVTLPPALAQALVEDGSDRLMLRLDGFQIDSRASLRYVPYLIVEGKLKS